MSKWTKPGAGATVGAILKALERTNSPRLAAGARAAVIKKLDGYDPSTRTNLELGEGLFDEADAGRVLNVGFHVHTAPMEKGRRGW